MSRAAYWRRMLSGVTRKEVRAFVGLADAQAVLERQALDPPPGYVMESPEGAACLATLEAILEAGRGLGVLPDEALRDEFTTMLREGWLIRDPPPDKATEWA